MSDLVQVVVIPKDDQQTHEDVVVAAATASVKALLLTRSDPAWDEWLAGSFTKSVRRGTPSQVAAAAEIAVGSAAVGTSHAFALAPMRYVDLPKPIAKTQVQGTDFHRSGSWLSWMAPEQEVPWVALNSSAQMTTGKTAAQAAHALMAAVLKEPTENVVDWADGGFPWYCRYARDGWFDVQSNIEACSVHIQDAGFTEVEPGTTTAVAGWWH